MKLLFKAALLHRRRLRLLVFTFLFMLGMTLASQIEMLSLGAITSSGVDFFTLFSPSDSASEQVTRAQIEAQWEQLDPEGKGAVTRSDARRYIAEGHERNPLKAFLNSLVAQAELRNHLPVLAGALLVVALLKGISVFGAQYSKQLVMIRVSRDMRQRYFEHIQTMPLQFYQKYHVGSLSSRVQTDAIQIAEGVYSGLTAYIQTPIAVLTSLALCFYVSLELSMVVFVVFPLVIFPILWIAKRVKRAARSLLQNNERLSSVLIETVSGILTVKLFAGEKLSIAKFRHHNDEMAQLESKAARYAFLARPILHMAATMMLAFIILYGTYWAQLTIAEILVFCGLVYLMYEPIKKLNDENLRVQRGSAAAERMFEVLQLAPAISDAPGAVAMQELQRGIELVDVGFRYAERPVLHGINCTIKRGEMVAVVGPTGAGKSTLVKLLPRLYEPESGQILIDGRPLHAYTQESLRKAIAFVPQKPFFFLDTVRENIAFGGQFSQEAIEHAARRAYAHEFIAHLPHGYDSMLAERGKDLSGGQQQRLSIARALVRGAPILVLDEATSSLDAVSENKIKEALLSLRGEITQLVIAHRLSTVEHADRILYLEGGQITAQGTKDQLLETCAGFRAMWDAFVNGVPQ